MISKLLIGMGHPAHFHLFRNTIYQLRNDGVEVMIVLTEKDILERLLKAEDFEFIKIAGRKKNEGVTDKIIKLANSTIELIRIVREFKPDLLIGSLSQLSYAGKLSKIPVLFFGEDDITYTWMQCLVTYPFVNYIVAPDKTKVGIFRNKKISYPGYQKLAYLHPKVFQPDAALIPEIDTTQTYTIIRLVSLTAYHDVNVGGIGNELLDQIIRKLLNYGKVYITSEKRLPEHLMIYSLPIKTVNIHHALSYASLFIGDSQSMCVEAAMLGVPSLKFNDFAGRISILEDLEMKYKLSFGFKTTQGKELLSMIDELFSTNDLKAIYQERRTNMLNDKIDVTSFYVWLIKNFPDSINQFKSGHLRLKS
jgi:hypothetical protein